MKRYTILAAAVVMQTCLGATYSWSVYVQPLRASTGLMQGTVQIPFTLFYLVFPATMVWAGSLLPRLGPRRCAIFGGVVFGCGWLLAGLGSRHFALTVLGIGGLAGIGVGFAYIVPIAISIRWFPRHKGLVAGIAVAGFGGGAAVVSQVGSYFMHQQGFSPFAVFSLLGVVFLVLVTLAGTAMENPTETAPSVRELLPTRQIIGAPFFWLLYTAMVCGLAAGFTVNANLKELCAACGREAGVTAVALFALANAAGRVVWGSVFDRWDAVGIMRTNLVIQAVLLMTAGAVLRTPIGLQVFALLTGFNYGGVLVIYVSAVARRWGPAKVGQVYGWLFSANIPAALAPLAAGYVYDFAGGFGWPMAFIAGCMLLAALLMGRGAREVGKAT